MAEAPHLVRRWFATIDARELSLGALRDAVAEALRTALVVHVANAVPDREALRWWDIVGAGLGRDFGYREGLTSGAALAEGALWMDVRYDPAFPMSFRHANVPQPLHTDGAYIAEPPDFGLFSMERQAGSGGESVFVDAATLADLLRERHPVLFADCFELPVHIARPPDAGQHGPIMRRVSERVEISWNYYRIMPGQDERVVAFCERFHALLGELAATPLVREFRLASGDAVFFDDRAVLHGRRAFTAHDRGDRLLWKRYFCR
jgi:alpha-ketoglutarate-dependent taurine dioxygenase